MDKPTTDVAAEAMRRRDLILEARKMWWEIVELDGGECRHMGIVRELADEVESLAALLSATPAPPAPMTGADVLAVFRPLPPEEAQALRAVFGDGTEDSPAPPEEVEK